MGRCRRRPRKTVAAGSPPGAVQRPTWEGTGQAWTAPGEGGISHARRSVGPRAGAGMPQEGP